ncbi:hypothetical protein FOA43_000409 [Brettanomyces nanus]|uniref:Putative lipase ATG15 n=1 Tax=Eeniella nana TaxID=13502 RepID=A0A875S0Z1_EENNA|nr:uncharacterized protein FOA43_000409 [Brettanomyces nanus]QPG73104.1 hypothetical protein FOA43_000409 [Brettanomyces nanus]
MSNVLQMDDDYSSGHTSFALKHIFHNAADGHTHKRLDIDDQLLDSLNIKSDEPLSVTQQPFTHIFDMSSDTQSTIRMANRDPDFVESYLNYAFEARNESFIHLDWSEEQISIPNITDPETILNLAEMCSDAYAKLPSDPSWRDVGDHYKLGRGFGWKKGGVRGHVFVEKVPKLEGRRPPKVIIALKGTSASGIVISDDMDATGDDGETVDGDKLNDNLLFSCCCARVSSLWTTVCDCYEGSTYQCDETCIEREFRRPDRYYKAALDIYRNVSSEYPRSEIWITGHSLGGALASLVGRTYGLPAVTFESPGERLPTTRLHLPVPPGLPEEYEHIWHFGNTADPIFLGICNGASSSCNIAGYAMETQCHSGLVCTYDSVKDLGWHVNMLNHRLKNVIDNVLSVYNETAPCVRPPPCMDCYNWYFVDHSDEKYKAPIKSSSTPAGSTPTDDPSGGKCLKRTWYGRCYKWEGDGPE